VISFLPSLLQNVVEFRYQPFGPTEKRLVEPETETEPAETATGLAAESEIGKTDVERIP
jgi:hypothetical protein